MADLPLTAATVSLAGHSADLSTTLYSLQEACSHETTSSDISAIATELALLSTTLWRLYEAMSADSDQYTESFNQDLAEIVKELKMVFEEISDCCEELQKADSSHSGAVAWMFKKGRVHRLQKHLEALKTTLIVMRTVLWHGKTYGTQNSPGRLAESSPHTMHEDRVILETVFARNRNAIAEVHMLQKQDHQQSSSSSNDTPTAAGHHHRQLSSTSNVPPIPDILPPATAQKEADTKLARRFSKRGVRLAVHSAILDMGAHEAPTALKEKWIRQSRDRQNFLSQIDEVESAQEESTTEAAQPNELFNNPRVAGAAEVQYATSPVIQCGSEDKKLPKKRPSVKLVSSPMNKLMQKLSILHTKSTPDPNH